MPLNIGQSSPVNRQNAIVSELIEPLAEQLIYSVPSENPLAEIFDRQEVKTGAEIQEILVGDANIEEYDKDGKTTFAPRETDIISRYYSDYKHKVYTTTIYQNEIRKVVIDESKKNELVATLLSRLADTKDGFEYGVEKGVLSDIATNYSGLKAGTITSGTSAEMGEELTKMIRNTIDALRFKNDKFLIYNIAHPNAKIKQKAFFERIRIVLPYKVFNSLNIGYLANVWNLDKTDLLAKIVTIDTEDGNVYVFDKKAVFKYPQANYIMGQDNAEGGFRNEFLHSENMFGTSPLFKFAFIDASAIIEE